MEAGHHGKVVMVPDRARPIDPPPLPPRERAGVRVGRAISARLTARLATDKREPLYSAHPMACGSASTSAARSPTWSRSTRTTGAVVNTKALEHAARSARRRAALRGPDRRPAVGLPAPHPRHHDRDQRAAGAEGRAHRAHHHRGVPRRARDRPGQLPPRCTTCSTGGPRRWCRAGVAWRCRSGSTRSGAVLMPARRGGGARRAAERLGRDGVESVAVVFLFSYRSPAHEQRAAEIVAAALPGVSVSVSHRITQEWREYERTSTTVVNAYIQPMLDRYLGAFGRGLAGRGFGGQLLITQSNGGAFSVEAARHEAGAHDRVGPRGGRHRLREPRPHPGRANGRRARLISFDMGGTTAKCAVVERGLVQTTDEYHVDGPAAPHPGHRHQGGERGRRDHRVDRRRRGPGPGAAERGRRPRAGVLRRAAAREPTVTDANLVLGRHRRRPLPRRRDAARRRRGGARASTSAWACRSGLARATAAAGVVRLADVKMALAVRSITTERGLDPRDYALVAYGGGGPLHAVAIARELRHPAGGRSRRRRRRSRRGACSRPICGTTSCAPCWSPSSATDARVGGGALPRDAARDRGDPAAGGRAATCAAPRTCATWARSTR